MRKISGAVAVLVVACSTAEPITDPATDSRNEFPIVVYHESSSLKLVNVDGTDNRFLVPAQSVNWVNCSIDGTRVAYSTLPMPRKGGPTIADLFVVGTDGSGHRRLTPPTGMLWGPPAWSPNNSKLAVVYMVEENGEDGLAIIDPDGSGFAKVPGTSRGPGLGGTGAAFYDALSWSPDGAELLYHVRDSLRAVRVATGATRLVAPFGRQARWSPDGREIAFQEGSSLIVADRNGGSRRVVIPAIGQFHGFTWSKDGTRIIFRAYPAQLRSIAVTGGQSSAFTSETFQAQTPHWCGTP